jgi:hypothetical protein
LRNISDAFYRSDHGQFARVFHHSIVPPIVADSPYSALLILLAMCACRTRANTLAQRQSASRPTNYRGTLRMDPCRCR